MKISPATVMFVKGSGDGKDARPPIEGQDMIDQKISLTDDIVERTHEIFLNQASKSPSRGAPVERVLSVDAVMDVARAILWPETGSKKFTESDDGDATRAQSKEPSRCLESPMLDN